MSESNPALAAQQQHRGIAAGMGPSSKSHMYLMHKVIKLVFHFSRLQFIPRKYSQPKTKGLWRLLFFTFYLSLPTDFGNVRPSQPGRGLPVRSGSLDMNVSPQPASLQYPIRATSPYTVMQQQQQGMTGNHSMMANQAVMVNAGEGAGCSHVVSSRWLGYLWKPWQEVCFLKCKARAAQLKFFGIHIFHDYLSLNAGFCLISSHSHFSYRTILSSVESLLCPLAFVTMSLVCVRLLL